MTAVAPWLKRTISKAISLFRTYIRIVNLEHLRKLVNAEIFICSFVTTTKKLNGTFFMAWSVW